MSEAGAGSAEGKVGQSEHAARCVVAVRLDEHRALVVPGDDVLRCHAVRFDERLNDSGLSSGVVVDLDLEAHGGLVAVEVGDRGVHGVSLSFLPLAAAVTES